MFSLINVVFLKPLPFPEPNRLVTAWSTLPNQSLTEGLSSYLDFKDWREQSQSFAGLAALWTFPNGDVNLTGGGEPQRVSIARITPDFFSVLGVRPLYGVRRMVVGEGIRLAALGIVLGGMAAVALSALLSRIVVRVSTLDVTTFIVVPVVLAAVMLVATLLPAQRAARVDPIRALRAE